MINGFLFSGTFNQDGQWFLIRCDMAYYLMYLPPNYSSIYLPLITHTPTTYLPTHLFTFSFVYLHTYLYFTFI